MKGVLFTEFIELLEELMGLEFTNQVIEDAQLENQGAFTAVGLYSHHDFFKLLGSLSRHAGNPSGRLLKDYGECLFHRLSKVYKQDLLPHQNAFSFLLAFESIIRREIRKLHPHGDVPSLKARLLNDDTMEIHYFSPRKTGNLIEGMIQGCISYYKEAVSIQRKSLSADDSRLYFLLQKEAAYERN